MKVTKNELIVHSNTHRKFLKTWDQMNNAFMFHSNI
jgi:hypothetical protein